MTLARLSHVGAAIIAFAGYFGQEALAAEGPPPGVSSISQYVEVVPTVRGPRAVGGRQAHAAPLPRAAAEAVAKAGGRDAKALTQIATSPSLGAPTQRPPSGSSRAVGRSRSSRLTSSKLLSRLDRFAAPAPLSGVGTALGPGSGSLGGLSVILLVLTAFTGASVLIGRRSRRR